MPLLVDACAALGSLPATPHWDVLAGSAHKWGGPAGVGILAVRTGVRWRSPMPTDEAGRWAGFPDVPGAVAAATALEAATASLGQTSVHRARLLTILRERVPNLAPDIHALGRPDSAPHIVCFTVLYADGEVLVTELDRAGFAVSSGSACTADTRRPSHVLAAMGAITHGNLRVSLPPDATEADVAGFLAALPAADRRRAGIRRSSQLVTAADATVEARGVLCPVPIIRLARAASTLPSGSLIELLTDDPAAEYDVPAWCRLRGHELADVRAAGVGRPGRPHADPGRPRRPGAAHPQREPRSGRAPPDPAGDGGRLRLTDRARAIGQQRLAGQRAGQGLQVDGPGHLHGPERGQVLGAPLDVDDPAGVTVGGEERRPGPPPRPSRRPCSHGTSTRRRTARPPRPRTGHRPGDHRQSQTSIECAQPNRCSSE